MMGATVKPLVAGNWKMNGLKASMKEIAALAEGYDERLRSRVDVMICPPATMVFTAATSAIGTRVKIGAQDCHAKVSGAHTGDVSAEMLADAGAVAIIVGHSERRADHGESNADVKAKAEAVWRSGLVAIGCVGEADAGGGAGKALDGGGDQLAGSLAEGLNGLNMVVAYEPVWAIGTGKTPTPADVAEVHGFIRARLVERFGAEGEKIRLLYGGSVKPSNAKELMAVANVNGALVGGASLKAADFLGIIAAYA